MLKQPITYTDYNGVTRTEDFYFNLDKLEIMELEIQFEGGLTGKIDALMATEEGPEVYNLFKDILLKAYGKKSTDGRRFMKGDDIRLEFMESPALGELIFSFFKSPNAAAEFMAGLLPQQAEIDKIKTDFEAGMLAAGQQVPAVPSAGTHDTPETQDPAPTEPPKPEDTRKVYRDYTEQELLEMPLEQFQALLPRNVSDMDRDQLQMAMRRKNQAQ